MIRGAAWLLVLLLPVAAAADELKIATLAPSGSAWASIMEEGGARLAADTQGRVMMRNYFSGQQGDERDMVRKMKLGQLDGAALTAVGLGLIVPDVLVFQLPYLFSSDKQLDFVRRELGPELEKKFDAAGYVLVSWGDVGWVHTYSTVRLDGPRALAAARAWAPADDPISREYLGLLHMNAVPLGVGEVLTALQTGNLDVCFGPPLAVVALQWHTRLKIMTDQASAYAIGALVIRKESFARLSPADQERLLAGGRETGARLIASVRRDNLRARRALERLGIVVYHIPDDAEAQLRAAGKQVWTRLAGKLYSRELLDRVVDAIGRTPP